jgi:hypothetical protein
MTYSASEALFAEPAPRVAGCGKTATKTVVFLQHNNPTEKSNTLGGLGTKYAFCYNTHMFNAIRSPK